MHCLHMVRHEYTWEEETLIIDLYTRTPTSDINDKNQGIISLCETLNHYGYGCVVPGIRNKMENLKSVDSDYISNGRVGRTHIAKDFMNRWIDYQKTGFIGLDKDVENAYGLVEKHNPSIPQPKRKGRDGQAVFRERVLAAFDNQCCISRMNTPQLIQACHIKPYSVCIAEKRLDQANDVRNGLCMNILYHKAFDKGLFSIDEDKRIVLSPSLELKRDDSFFLPYEGEKILETGRTIIGEQYLEYHRKNVFTH